MKRSAYHYRRFSTLNTANPESLRRQAELCEAHCRKHDLRLDDTLKLNLIGRRGRMLSLVAAFTEAVKEGTLEPGSVLVVESLKTLGSVEELDALHEAGVEVHTLVPEAIIKPVGIRGAAGTAAEAGTATTAKKMKVTGTASR